jgi:hypothetical protein
MEEIKKYYKLARENKKITMAIIIVIIMLIALIN